MCLNSNITNREVIKGEFRPRDKLAFKLIYRAI